MSFHSAGLLEDTSPEGQVSPNPVPDIDEVDLVQDSHLLVQEGRDKKAAVERQNMVSDADGDLIGNNQSARFSSGARRIESFFEFTPAPRYASGHFSNRRIVPRTDGPETHQQENQQLPSHTVSEEEQSVQRLATPSCNAAEAPMKDAGLTKKIGLPFGKNPLPPVISDEHRACTARAQLPHHNPPGSIQCKESLSLPPQEADPGQSSKSSTRLPHPPPSGEQHAGSGVVEVVTSPDTATEAIQKSSLVPEPRPADVRNHPQHALKSKREAHPGEGTPAELTLTNQHVFRRPLEKPRGPTTITRFDAQTVATQRMSSHQSVQPSLPEDYHQVDHPSKDLRHTKVNNRSPSMSSNSSILSRKRRRSSTNDLALLRERAFPQVASNINDLFRLSDQAVKDAHVDKDAYRKKLDKRTRQLADLVHTSKIMNQEIETSNAEKQGLQAHIKGLEQQLQGLSEKFSTLTKKCRTIQNMFSSALKEKQELWELHCSYKKNSERAIQDIRAEKQHEQSLRQLVDRQLSAVRDQMKERVRQVEEQSRDDCCRMRENMESVQQQAAEKDAQVKREREISDQLTKQLEQFNKTQSSLDDLGSQTSKLARMLGDRDIDDKLDRVMLVQEESKARLDNVAEHAESLRDLLGPHCEAVTTLGNKQDEATSKIIATLHAVHEAQNGSNHTMEHFGKDMRGLIDEIWQHLETREDSLTQLLEQKQGENATLRSVLEKGEQERQELQQQVGEMNKLHKSYEGQLQDLLHKVGKFETQQRVDSEAKACSEALAKENEDLKAQLETKCSTIAALDSQLTSESKSYRAQMESLSKEVAKLTHLMNESDHNARLMTEKAVAKTREECLADHQRTLEKVQERLQEAREARHLAVTELEEAKTQLKAMTITQGENGEQADKTAALRTALGDADLRNTKLADDLHGMAGKLSTQTRVFESIGKWASAKADALGLTFSLDKMWTDARTDGDEGKQWTSFLEAVLAEFSMGREAPRASSSARVAALQPSLNAQTHPRALHGTVQPLPPQSVQQSQEAGKRAGNAGDQSYQSLETGYDLPSREESSGLAAGSKRATVLSPDSGVLSPAPPSVEQERSRRRSNVQQPKPIIKRVTRSTLQGEEVRVGQSGDPAKIPPSTGSRNNPKRPRQTGQLQADNPFSPALVLEQDDDPIEDNEDAPQPKRAKAQKPKAVSVPRRGRDPASQPKQQTRRSGLAAPGVAHGRLPPRVPGIVANRHGLSSEPQNAS